jgi:membrane protein insertase Oxa1/YidC/SpoIIIJ
VVAPTFKGRQFSTSSGAEKVVETAAVEPGFFSAIANQGAEVFKMLHEVSGVPYWGVIVGTSFAVRFLLMPLLAMQMRNGVLMADAKPEMDLIQQEFRLAGNAPEARMKYYNDIKVSKRNILAFYFCVLFFPSFCKSVVGFRWHAHLGL